MKKRRSKGVVIFAWSFIIFNAVGFFTAGSPFKNFPSLSRLVLSIILLYIICYNIAGIIVGVNLLKQKEWSRRIIVILAILGIAHMILFVPLKYITIEKQRSDPRTIAMLEQQYDFMPEATRLRMNLSRGEFIDTSIKIGHVIMGISSLVLIVYVLLILFFFTRPKIKEQFS